MINQCKTCVLLLLLLTSYEVHSASAADEFPIVVLDCGAHVAEPGHSRVPIGGTTLRVYPGEEVPVRISLQPREDRVPELPLCLGSWDDYLATVVFRLLREHDDLHPSRGEDEPLRPWWDVVDERTVDVTIRSEPVAYQRPSYMPHRRVVIDGLESLPPGDYRLLGFQTGASLGRCRGNLLDDQPAVVANACFLRLGPPVEGPDRVHWLWREASHDLRAGALASALEHALELVSLRPNSARAQGLLGRVQAAGGDCGGATTSLTTALSLAESQQPNSMGARDNPSVLRRGHVPEWERLLRECEGD